MSIKPRTRLTAVVASALLFVLGLAMPAYAQGPTVSFNDVSITETNSNQTATFTLTLSQVLAHDVTVKYDTAQGFPNSSTPAACDDVQDAGCQQPTITSFDFDKPPANSMVTIPAGQTTAQVNITVFGDSFDEENEVFAVFPAEVTGAGIATDADGRGDIFDEDSPPSMTISDTTITEGNSGQVNGTLTLTISGVSQKVVGTSYATVAGTAQAGVDYPSRSGTVTLNPGQTQDTVPVTVVGDTNDENDENFFYNLTNPQNVNYSDSQGTVTITDDDTASAPTISIGDVTVTEGNSGTVNAVMTATLSGTSPNTVTVNYATAPGTATNGVDYNSVTGTLTFNPGETSKSLAVVVNGDTTNEPNETVNVNLTNPSFATISDAQGVVTINNDDGVTPSPSPSPSPSPTVSPSPSPTTSPSPSPTPSATPTPAVSVNDTSVTEGDDGTTTATLTVSLSAPGTKVVNVAFETSDGTATFDDADFDDKSGSLAFQIGQTSRTVAINVRGDTADEDDEEFHLDLFQPQNATIADDQGDITIIDDDEGGGPVVKDPTAVSLFRSSTKKRIKISGDLNPAHPGDVITVELLKKRDGRFIVLQTKEAELGDGVPSTSGGAEVSPFSTKFKRPKKGKCKIKATYAGDDDHEGSTSKTTFNC